MSKQRTFAALELSDKKVQTRFLKDTVTQIPVNKVPYAFGVTAEKTYSQFRFTRVTENLHVRYTIGLKTTRQGARVELPIEVGIKLNGKLVSRAMSIEPYYQDSQYSGIKGTVEFEHTFSVGDTLELVLLHREVSCDLEINFLRINIFDGLGVNKATASPTGSTTIVEGEPWKYVHHQGVPKAIWIIDHPLNGYPNIKTTDEQGRTFEGQEEYINKNQIKVTFNGAFSGYAYLS